MAGESRRDQCAKECSGCVYCQTSDTGAFRVDELTVRHLKQEIVELKEELRKFKNFYEAEKATSRILAEKILELEK